MNAYYNEIDPHAAQWLRNLISAGHIAPGVVANTTSERLEIRTGETCPTHGQQRSERLRAADRMGNAISAGPQGHSWNGGDGNKSGRICAEPKRPVAQAGASVGLSDPSGFGRSEGRSSERTTRHDGSIGNGAVDRSGPLYGPWANADWLFCRDGKWRPVEPGTFPLAHGATSRMGRLRAYGNGLCAEQATGFIRAYMDRGMADLSEQAGGDLFEYGELK